MNLFNINWLDLLISIPAVLICITFHEFSHGYVAYKLGDPTARNSGRLSLNPIVHIDPFGMICLVLFRFGWAKPVPVNPGYFKNPKTGMMATALAGPVSNIILAFIIMILMQLINIVYYLFPGAFSVLSALYQFLSITAIISVGLAVFNLIPVPPLDGSKILLPLLPDRFQAFVHRYQMYLSIALMVLLYLGFLNLPLTFLRSAVLIGLDAAATGLFSLFGV